MAKIKSGIPKMAQGGGGVWVGGNKERKGNWREMESNEDIKVEIKCSIWALNSLIH